jgi:hypothetical protein
MKKAKAAVESASVDKKREPLIRATKMNAAPGRLFVCLLITAVKSIRRCNEYGLYRLADHKNMIQITT